MFQPMVEAISEGRVVHRRWQSANTGLETRIETIVDLGDGQVWVGEHTPNGQIPHADGEMVSEDHHFLPYRRR